MEAKPKKGRYGNDHFNKFIFALCIIFLVLMLTIHRIFLVLALSTMLFAYIRLFSRNIEQRTAENNAFLAIIAKLKHKPGSAQTKDKSQPQLLYCNCPQCDTLLSLPQEQINLTINCPNCNTRFSYSEQN